MHLVLLVMLVAQISTSFSIPVPCMSMLYHNFYCIFSFYFLLNDPGLKWLNSCVNLTGVVQWLGLVLSKGPNWVGVSTPLHLRRETDLVFKTCFYSLISWMMEKVKKNPVILYVIHCCENCLESTNYNSLNELHTPDITLLFTARLSTEYSCDWLVAPNHPSYNVSPRTT
jgi:hypothetical protein